MIDSQPFSVKAMSEKVVSLRGAHPVQSSQPNTTVIEELERLLEAAKAGEIVGLAGTYVHKDKVVTYSYAGAVGSYAMLGGLDCVKERLLRIAMSQEG
ncbi:hypothetical protein [Beijerinckia indica]|uniref:Uncharacterized protein n=1 Tax=Beijerinckia indica subsp. indica (strain ATCC 9039 / DSM 1715 / NCIMB 8712) TaxID=395963 RepID=B2ID02_BEII9|nr:hypothetical protein [Beijerinckia indica]ACB96767.1 conserved hypothetical protein [Beijerinckia indica subsp. indica ATCC 9039]